MTAEESLRRVAGSSAASSDLPLSGALSIEKNWDILQPSNRTFIMTSRFAPAFILVLAVTFTSCSGDETGKSKKAEPLSEADLIKLSKSDIEDEDKPLAAGKQDDGLI